MKKTEWKCMLIVAIALSNLLAFAAVSCAAAQANVIRIEAGAPQQGTFQSPNLNIDYSYTLSQNQLTVAGQLNFADSLTMNYRGLQQFYIEVLLLDAQGAVMERKNVHLKSGFTWGDAKGPAISSFKGQLTVPEGAVAMTFYYNGITQGSVGDSGGSSFWYDPISGKK